MNKLVVLAAAAMMGTAAAHATEVLSFGQSVAGSAPITGTESGGVTTIMANAAPISLTSCLLCSTIIGSETLTLDATSVGPAFSFHGFVVQNFTGTFEILSSTGQNILSGSFSDATFGAGTSLTLSASNAFNGETLTFTSGVIKSSILDPKAMSLSLADVTPFVGTTDGSLSSFTGSIAGTFSASPRVTGVPEPGAASMMLLGLAGIGVAAWRRRRK
jgi:hypothetical protein